MAEKLRSVNGVFGTVSSVGNCGDLGSKTLIESGGITEERKVMIGESSSESVSSRIEREVVESGMPRSFNVSRNRVLEKTLSQDDEWRSTKSVICIVERLLKGKFGLQYEDEEIATPEKKLEAENEVADHGIRRGSEDIDSKDAVLRNPGCRDSGSKGVVLENTSSNEEEVQDSNIEDVNDSNTEGGVLIPESRRKHDVSEKDGEFFVSDLVWGKVKGHPWWPGQIFIPSAASERARKHFKRDSYLIAYFGDQSFAWNEASKIKHFRKHFSEMERQSTSEKFGSSVNSALDEFTRRVELGLSCSCLPPEIYSKMKSRVFLNAGIREESSLVNRGGECMHSAYGFHPREIVRRLGSFAESAKTPKNNRLDIVATKARVLAFNRWRCKLQQLPVLQEFGPPWEDLSVPSKKRNSDSPRRASDGDTRTKIRKKQKQQLLSTLLTPQNDGPNPEMNNERRPDNEKKKRSISATRHRIESEKKPKKTVSAGGDGIPRLNVILSNLRLAAKRPVQGGHHIVGTSISKFLRRFRDAAVREKSALLGDDNSGCRTGTTSLILHFEDLETMPSSTDLKGVFGWYGAFGIEISRPERSVRVEFKRRADAESAYGDREKFEAFGGGSLVRCRLS